MTITNTLKDPFSALEDFKVFLEKARKRTVHELLRKTPNSLWSQAFDCFDCTTSVQKQALGYASALLVKRGNLWENALFDAPFECIDCHGLSQIIASLTRE